MVHNEVVKMSSIKKVIIKGIISLIFFILMSIYIGLIQNAYDSNVINYSAKIVLFASIIFLGSFSYDIAKSIMFMHDGKFNDFWNNTKRGGYTFLICMVLILITALLINEGGTAMKTFGYYAYFLAFIAIGYTIYFGSEAVHAATRKDEDEEDENLKSQKIKDAVFEDVHKALLTLANSFKKDKS